ncbi:hypothetical protein ACROYT_G025773 [Oculina patagonica]
MDTGRHIRVTERETVYDLARKEWAEKVTGIQSSHVAREAVHLRESTHVTTRKEPLQGWALKAQRKGQRATEGVKTFLVEKFNRGVETGNKFTPRLAAAQRQSKAPTALIEEAENIDENDLEAWEAEKHLQELQTAVYEEVDLRHPIEYKGQDICGLVKRGMLKSKFKIAQLKELCDLYGMEIDGSIARKDSYVRPIEHLVKTCSCSKE